MKSKGNMYPWVTHTHSHLGGKCGHECSYCYVQAMAKSFHNVRARYSGPPRLIRDELDVKYGSGKTIFIEHMADMWGPGVSSIHRDQIFSHLAEFPDNFYVFQSKNPPLTEHRIRGDDLLGTTIESERWYSEVMGEAPTPPHRARVMVHWKKHRPEVKRFLTLEPLLDFHVVDLADMVCDIEPAFVNIGADSKGRGLPEPTWDKVATLIHILEEVGIEIRQKSNLERLRR